MAADVRKIPLSEVLSSRGFVARKEGNSTMWRGNAQAINVTGDALWFDHKAGKGGVGTIDLVMHLDGQSFREAVNSLAGGRYSSSADLDAVAVPFVERRPLAEMMDEYARREDTRWPHAFAYFTKRRCLPADVIEELHKTGRVYANDRGGVVFLHHDEKGHLGGATIKSTNPYSNFAQCVGNKTGSWFHVGSSPQRLAQLQSQKARSTPFLTTRFTRKNTCASCLLQGSLFLTISCESVMERRPC